MSIDLFRLRNSLNAIRNRLSRREAAAADGLWVESDHPRNHGRFASKGDGETYSQGDAVAVHEALAKANGELLKAAENDGKGTAATSRTPMSDYAKASAKVRNLIDISRIVKPGARIKSSGIGAAHRQMFREADRLDTRPEYGPEGAKTEVQGWRVKTHPYHQAVVEAFQDIGREAKAAGVSS